jgi:hypothetical protein
MRRGSKPRGGRAKKPGALVGAVALAAGVLVGLGPAARAQAVTPEPVMSSAAGEFQPVRDNGFLAWQRNTKKRPNRFNVFAMPDGEDRFKVNAGKTNAANGGIDGTSLVYQEYKGGQSDLKFFDLLTQKRTGPPKGVNTKFWEYWPRMSGQWILFGRLLDNGDRKLILYDRNARTGQQVDMTTSPNGFLAPGQVSGDYAVWYKCPPSEDCDVYRYQISTDDKFKIPNPGNTQHAPSVTRQGTVYFARNECGSQIRLMRYPLDGPATVLTQLPRGGDVSSTRTHIADNGAVELFYEHNVCQDPVGSDLWKITEPALYDLSVTKQGGGDGTVTSSPAGVDCGADCASQYEEGTSVTLTAASQGQSSFKGWDGSCSGTQNTCTLTMDEAKDVIANFDPPPNLANLAVTKSGPGSGTVTSSPAGVNCGTDCSENYPVGTSVTLTAAAAAKSTFGGWGGACTGTGTTCTLTMDAGKTTTATFNTVTHTMTVTRAGNGAGTVTSSPSGINCGADCSENFAIDSSVTLTAAATGTSTFTGWTAGACSGNSTVCTVTMNQARSATASFTLSIHSLNVTRSGAGTGTVTSAPAGINCGVDCNEGYDHGTSVTLTAAPAADSVVGTWTGCNSTPTPDTCTVALDAAKNVDAEFNIATRTLTVTVDGNGSGTVTSNPPGIADCPGPDCSEGYDHGTPVTLTAAPGANSAVTWAGCTVGGNPNECSVTMDADKPVTATFTLATRTLTVITDGTGTGTVTSSPAGITCGSGGADCTEGYPHGQAVQLTAAPDAGASVTWAGCTVDGVNPNKCDVTMDADKTVTATFTAAPPPPGPWTLTVDGQGDGTGNVMSNPAGINCDRTAGADGPNIDCTEDYADGTPVELTASGTHAPPAWSGCTVDGVDPNICRVTMDAAKSVTATFDDPFVFRRRSVTGPALILGYPTLPSGDVDSTRAVHDSWWYLFSG